MFIYPGSLVLCVPRAGVCNESSPYLEPLNGNTAKQASGKTLLFSLTVRACTQDSSATKTIALNKNQPA